MPQRKRIDNATYPVPRTPAIFFPYSRSTILAKVRVESKGNQMFIDYESLSG